MTFNDKLKRFERRVFDRVQVLFTEAGSAPHVAREMVELLKTDDFVHDAIYCAQPKLDDLHDTDVIDAIAQRVISVPLTRATSAATNRFTVH